MIITLNIDGEERKFDLNDGRLTTINEEPTQPKTGWERVNVGEPYFTLTQYKPHEQGEDNDANDQKMYDSANYLSDGKIAADVFRAQEIWRKLLRWQAEHDKPVGIHDEAVHIGYYPKGFFKREAPPFVGIGCVDTREIAATFDVLFSSGDIAHECIDEFRDELTWLFTEFKSRLDA